jgi:hypothetical protein
VIAEALGVLALVLAAAFTGAAFYVVVAEHPGRMLLRVEQAVAQWVRSYTGASVMQASLAALGGICAVAAWGLGKGALFLVGGLILLANWPWTLVVIKPVNHRLIALNGNRSSAVETLPLLNRWARLHGVRAGLGLIATLLLAVACLRQAA